MGTTPLKSSIQAHPEQRQAMVAVLSDSGADLVRAMQRRGLYVVEIATLAQEANIPRQQAAEALAACVTRGELCPLADGRFALRKAACPMVPATAIALQAYQGGALSGLWALSYYGLIMETVFAPTIVSPSAPRSRLDVRNEWGPFRFEHMERRFMREGYFRFSYSGFPTRLARPEKALADHIRLSRSWTGKDMETIRLQPIEGFDYGRFLRLADYFGSPQVSHAARKTAAFLKALEAEYVRF